MRQQRASQPRWRQLRSDDIDGHVDGLVVVMRPTDRIPGQDRYWCGPADPDSSVTWLRHDDPLTGEITVPERMALFEQARHAVAAWGRYLGQRRRRGTPVVAEFAHFMPVAMIQDWSRPPPWPPPAATAPAGITAFRRVAWHRLRVLAAAR